MAPPRLRIQAPPAFPDGPAGTMPSSAWRVRLNERESLAAVEVDTPDILRLKEQVAQAQERLTETEQAIAATNAELAEMDRLQATLPGESLGDHLERREQRAQALKALHQDLAGRKQARATLERSLKLKQTRDRS